MSVTENDAAAFPEPSYTVGDHIGDAWGDGPMPYQPGERPTFGNDRTPPQDMAAEQSVLGSMLLSKDAIADVTESLRGTDFYRPAHEMVHDAIIDLYGRGEPADPVTVGNELTRRGELARVGGAPYLHTLAANVPIAANAGYYAEIVREKAVLRRLVAAGTKIVQIGYAGEGQVDDVVDQAQAEIYHVTEKRATEDYAPLSDIMESVLDEIEAIGNRESGLYGVPTGFADLDDLTNGLHGGQMIIVAGRPAMGKALALDTPLPTPTGWTTMSELRVGDLLLDASGQPTRVVAATQVMTERPCFELRFSDGARIVADAEHQWLTTAVHYGRNSSSRTIATSAEGFNASKQFSENDSDGTQIRTTAVLAVSVDEIHTIRLPDGSLVKVESVEPVLSVPVRCVEVNNAEHLYLAGPTSIPTHNSTLGLDFCRAASIHNNMASVIFSLEMNRSEITMRLLSAEAKVPLNHIRNGNMGDDDWQRLARKMGEVSSAPMFIDDSPNMTMMEIRSKARRLKQRHDLKLIVIDYMQLMSSGKKVESRQLEVSEFSRQIKLLAKELEVPIVALSQLNRGPEQRGDKRPMMSDLRESGCVTADTRVMRADTNAEVTIGELMSSGTQDIPVWALDDRLKLVPRMMTHAFPSGTKDVFRLTLASGRTIKATGNHPFLTYDGWMPLRELGVGTRVASVRHVPPPLQVTRVTNAEIMTLISAGLTSPRAGLPTWAFSLPKDQVGLMLRTLWSQRGSVLFDEDHDEAQVRLTTSSRRLVDDLARLLARFNVFTRVAKARRAGREPGWHLYVHGVENQLRFLDDVTSTGPQHEVASRLAARLRAAHPKQGGEAVTGQVWGRVHDILIEPPVARTEHGSVTTQAMARVAEVLDDSDIEVLATNDVQWDAIAVIEPLGSHEVFDATVLGVHNFVADGIAIHNSLEQDADMVVLLHRDDVYEKESTRPGEADLIVAKHRNGPTRDITVAFQGHYSRFVDMAH